jgi:hypothetical protein
MLCLVSLTTKEDGRFRVRLTPLGSPIRALINDKVTGWKKNMRENKSINRDKEGRNEEKNQPSPTKKVALLGKDATASFTRV